jgi:hypothetical protein
VRNCADDIDTDTRSNDSSMQQAMPVYLVFITFTLKINACMHRKEAQSLSDKSKPLQPRAPQNLTDHASLYSRLLNVCNRVSLNAGQHAHEHVLGFLTEGVRYRVIAPHNIRLPYGSCCLIVIKPTSTARCLLNASSQHVQAFTPFKVFNVDRKQTSSLI